MKSGGHLEVLAAFSRLGVTAFGGPVAHLGYFREEFVVRRRWLDDAAYADLVALCQFLPGPASSQVCFALGLKRAGLGGGLLASLAFTLPSALLMIFFALGIASLDGVAGSGWLQGLKTAAVGVVAHAVWGMARKLCPDLARGLLALGAAVLALTLPGVGGQLSAIGAGALIGWVLFRRHGAKAGESPVATPGSRRRGFVALGAFALLLVGLPLLAGLIDGTALAMFDRFYRSGSLVFGGGHVVLPLLRAEVVPPGWVADDTFLAGYGAAQAVPGPLFTFAAFLGASMEPSPSGWAGGFWCLLAIFLPALLLVGGALPFWERLRASRPAQAAMRGTNAAVVGILAAALWNPVIVEGVVGLWHAGLAVAAFAALQFAKAPAWLVVGLCAGLGALIG